MGDDDWLVDAFQNLRTGPRTDVPLSELEDEQDYYGHFKCKKCRKTWTSGFAYKSTFQQCKACKTKNLAYRYDEKKTAADYDSDDEGGRVSKGPHLAYLCGRCKRGLDCKGAART